MERAGVGGAGRLLLLRFVRRAAVSRARCSHYCVLAGIVLYTVCNKRHHPQHTPVAGFASSVSVGWIDSPSVAVSVISNNASKCSISSRFMASMHTRWVRCSNNNPKYNHRIMAEVRCGDDSYGVLLQIWGDIPLSTGQECSHVRAHQQLVFTVVGHTYIHREQGRTILN